VIAVGHFGGDHADAASKARAVQKVVAMIENCFCQADVVKVPTPLAEKPAEATAFPAHKAPKCIIFKDEEIDSTSISVEYKRRHRPIQSLADYREYIIEDMFISTLNHRLMKIALQEGSPFVNASLSINNPAPHVVCTGLYASCGAKMILPAIQAVLEEFAAARDHGFEENELDMTREDIKAELRAQLSEKDQVESVNFAGEYFDHFMYGTPSPGIVEEVRLTKAHLDTITPAEVQAYANTCFQMGGADLVFSVKTPLKDAEHDDGSDADEGATATVTATVGALWQWIRGGEATPDGNTAADAGSEGDDDAMEQAIIALVKNPAGFAHNELGGRLASQNASSDGTPKAVPTLPPLVLDDGNTSELSKGGALWEKHHTCVYPLPENGGEPVKEGASVPSSASQHATLDFTETVLSNGIRVTYARTNKLDDQIVFGAFAYGGLSQLKREDYRSAQVACSVSSEIGEFGVSPSELQDLLSGKRLSLSSDIGTYRRDLSGSCSPNDLEMFLHMLHVLFRNRVSLDEASTKGAADKSKLKQLLSILEESTRNANNNPQNVFTSTVNKINSCDHWIYRPHTPESVRSVDIDLCCDVYSDSFSDPSQFTMCFVGALEPEKMKVFPSPSFLPSFI
jgi:hypothetical protein